MFQVSRENEIFQVSTPRFRGARPIYNPCNNTGPETTSKAVLMALH